ncbi:hypothetical protein EAY30_26400, partial [Vibrio anguillarum]|nr:hypothetical protein [Vibrio anguillarum]
MADYHERNDSYTCQKKMDTYVIKYGPSYVSEIYYYLVKSQLLYKYQNSPLNVISLGCGFAPDYYALQKYNIDHRLNIQLSYQGLDMSTSWNTARPQIGANCQFRQVDLTRPFSLQGADIVFVCKSFSTMYRNGQGEKFLNQLVSAINNHLTIGSVVVFIDVNLNDFGRDEFHTQVSPIVSSNTQYFFRGST